MTDIEKSVPPVNPWWNVDYFPVGAFGSVMGLTGLSIAWQVAHDRHGAPAWPGRALAILAMLDFGLVALTYLLKAIVAPQSVAAEFRHPIGGCLFGTIFVSLLLLPIVIEPYSLAVALAVWMVGAAGMLVFAVAMFGRWLRGGLLVQHVAPVWVIPIVGLLDVPLAMPILGLSGHHEAMVFALTVGLFFTVPIFTLVLQRILFDQKGSETLAPTFLVLMAPFAVGYSAYDVVTGSNDLFAQGLFMLAMFLLVVLAVRSASLVRTPFRLTWWATSFPLAAASIAALKFSAINPGAFAVALAWAALAVATLCIGALLMSSLIALGRGELRTVSGS